MRVGAQCNSSEKILVYGNIGNFSSINECSAACHVNKECRFFEFDNKRDTGCSLVKAESEKCDDSDDDLWRDSNANFYEIKEKGNWLLSDQYRAKSKSFGKYSK